MVRGLSRLPLRGLTCDGREEDGNESEEEITAGHGDDAKRVESKDAVESSLRFIDVTPLVNVSRFGMRLSSGAA